VKSSKEKRRRKEDFVNQHDLREKSSNLRMKKTIKGVVDKGWKEKGRDNF